METIQKKYNWPLIWIAIIGCFSIFFTLVNYYSEGIARAESISFGIIVLTTGPRWKMRYKHIWFWVTIVSIFIIQAILILHISWTSHWIPSFLIFIMVIPDIIIILWLLQIVEKYMNHGVLPNMPEKIQNQNEEADNS